MYLCHVVHALTFEAIGRVFGRDRTTVSYACRVVEDRRDDIWFDCRIATPRACLRHKRIAVRRGGGMSKATKSKIAPKDATGIQAEGVNAFRASHLQLADREIMMDGAVCKVVIDESESPLAWLARRKGRDGRFMINQYQFIAGEKLRTDFTRRTAIAARHIELVIQRANAGSGWWRR